MKNNINFMRFIQIIKKDFKLKLFSLAVGIVLWFVVIGGVNPVVSRQFVDVPVVFRNQSQLEKGNLVIVSPENPKVNVTIKGNRNEVSAITKKDIIAEVNLENGIISGTYRLNVNVKVPYNVQVKSISETEMLVTFDEEISKAFDVTVETKGEAKNRNQIVAKKESEIKSVLVTGPVSAVNKVKKVVATIDITNKDSEGIINAKLRAVDENSTIVDKVKLSETETNVSFGFQNFKEVPIELVTINSTAKDINILKSSVVPNSISIIGNIDELEKITSIKTKPLDLLQVKDSGVYPISLDLPSGISLVNTNTKISVNIDVDKNIEKTIKIEKKNIENIPEELKDKPEFTSGTVDVIISGYESIVSKINNEDIKLYILDDYSKSRIVYRLDMRYIEGVKLESINPNILKNE